MSLEIPNWRAQQLKNQLKVVCCPIFLFPEITQDWGRGKREHACTDADGQHTQLKGKAIYIEKQKMQGKSSITAIQIVEKRNNCYFCTAYSLATQECKKGTCQSKKRNHCLEQQKCFRCTIQNHHARDCCSSIKFRILNVQHDTTKCYPNEPGATQIDLLIGSDQYWEFMTGQSRKLEGKLRADVMVFRSTI